MPIHPELEPGEELRFSDTLKGIKGGKGLVPDIFFAVSDRALIIRDPLDRLAASKGHPAGRPQRFKRIPLGEVQRVEVTRGRVRWLWLVSPLLIAAGVGVFLSYWHVFAILGLAMTPGGPDPAESPLGLLPFALAAIAAGLLLPWVVRSRFVLSIAFGGRTYVWKSELLLGGEHKSRTRGFLAGVVDACRRAGLKVAAPRLD